MTLTTLAVAGGVPATVAMTVPGNGVKGASKLTAVLPND
jgi:hypothetical protein